MNTTTSHSNNNNNNNKEIKLNLFIFKLISFNLSINKSFNQLLEISLISKSVFLIIQNIITSYDFNKINKKFILSLYQFIKYIENEKQDSDDDDHDNYKFKLIQYKIIERIKVSNLPNKNNLLNLNSIFNNNNDYSINKKIEIYLKSKCLNLKSIILIDKIEFLSRINFDFTCNGFYKVKKLNLIFSISNPPLSFGEPSYTNQLLLSFQLLLNYNPSKIYIGTGKGESDEIDYTMTQNNLYINNLENILNFKSIKSIKLVNHPISNQFLKLILSSNENNNIESLKIDEYRYYGISTIKQLTHRIVYSDLKNNKTLNKFIIKCLDHTDHKVTYRRDDCSSLLLEIGNNKSIKTLGLIGFKIFDSIELEPLINIENITTLIIDSFSIEEVVEHCKLNSNINKLIIKYSKSIGDIDLEDFKIISSFLSTSSTSSSSLNEYSIFIYSNKKLKPFNKIKF